jgi:tripartite-type tricarboxylate transporter receptor subunit TctC
MAISPAHSISRPNRRRKKNTMKTTSLKRLLAVFLVAGATVAQAAFPDRPITIVVPYAPGGSADALARVLAVRMGVKLGTSVIVDNKSGASGTIGASFAPA